MNTKVIVIVRADVKDINAAIKAAKPEECQFYLICSKTQVLARPPLIWEVPCCPCSAWEKKEEGNG